DAALFEFDARSAALSPPQLIASVSTPYQNDLHRRLKTISTNPRTAALEVWEVDALVGEHFARVANILIAQSRYPLSGIAAIGSHGQTVFHAPRTRPPLSVQLGDPNIIAERTGLTVVADLRRRDIAAGGEGAPLAPLFHQAWFGTERENRCVLNLGGIANISLVTQGSNAPPSGFDTGPANTLMDHWSRTHGHGDFDRAGEWARSGSVDEELLARFLADPYFSQSGPKSTGPEYFSPTWLHAMLTGDESAQDVQRTLLELTARSIADAVRAQTLGVARLLVAGGGVHNQFLMERLTELLAPVDMQRTDGFGLPSRWLECAGMAWLAMHALNGWSLDLNAVTGSRGPLTLGGIYRGRQV
ncbi:MAG: anhydro-N-acetylmuramic acid kinase, partial [Gammaproteobacteria bacterium]|nr:anhydro-N-acetylmuramic acid kinase [Gammaproteobacteria bacterium]